MNPAEPTSNLIVVDTNILFSALLRPDSPFFEVLSRPQNRYYICETTLSEIFEHKERIVQISKLSPTDVTGVYAALLQHLHLFKESWINLQSWLAAYQLCKAIDEHDLPFVALTLELNGLLWTGDKKLKSGLLTQGFDRFFMP